MKLYLCYFHFQYYCREIFSRLTQFTDFDDLVYTFSDGDDRSRSWIREFRTLLSTIFALLKWHKKDLE